MTTTKALEDQLIDLEHRFWQAMKDQDVETAAALTADPCIITGAQGVSSIGKSEFAKLMQSESWTIEDFALSDVRVRPLGSDAAVVAYKVREKLTVEGERLTLEAADASTWIREGDRWLCALHTESIAGDPFGRERRPVMSRTSRRP